MKNIKTRNDFGSLLGKELIIVGILKALNSYIINKKLVYLNLITKINVLQYSTKYLTRGTWPLRPLLKTTTALNAIFICSSSVFV